MITQWEHNQYKRWMKLNISIEMYLHIQEKYYNNIDALIEIQSYMDVWEQTYKKRL